MRQQTPIHGVLPIYTDNITVTETDYLTQPGSSLGGKLAEAAKAEAMRGVVEIAEDGRLMGDIIRVTREEELSDREIVGRPERRKG